MPTVTGATQRGTIVREIGTGAVEIEAEIDEAGIEIDDDHVIGMIEEATGTATGEEESAIEAIETTGEEEEGRNAREIDQEIVEGQFLRNSRVGRHFSSSRRDRDDRRGGGGSRDERDFGRGDRGGFRDRSRSPRRDRGDRDMRGEHYRFRF